MLPERLNTMLPGFLQCKLSIWKAHLSNTTLSERPLTVLLKSSHYPAPSTCKIIVPGLTWLSLICPPSRAETPEGGVLPDPEAMQQNFTPCEF